MKRSPKPQGQGQAQRQHPHQQQEPDSRRLSSSGSSPLPLSHHQRSSSSSSSSSDGPSSPPPSPPPASQARRAMQPPSSPSVERTRPLAQNQRQPQKSHSATQVRQVITNVSPADPAPSSSSPSIPAQLSRRASTGYSMTSSRGSQLPQTDLVRRTTMLKESIAAAAAFQLDAADTASPTSTDELSRLRDAVKNAQVLSYGKQWTPSAAATAATRSNLSRHRSSSDNVAVSPSLDAAFFSPATGSVSTTSTESNRTVRGGFSGTPSVYEGRTPSYPFPYVPRTSSSGSTVHVPFTALSPTGDRRGPRPSMTVHDRLLSQSSSTPGEPAVHPFGPNNPHYASEQPLSEGSEPSLYDIVLQLNCELTLKSWWNTLATIMKDQYGVERMSIALPADPSDQNVPWAQKASYNASGIVENSHYDHHSGHDSLGRSASKASEASRRENRAQKQPNIGHPPTADALADTVPRRPHLQHRHSYAGYESSQSASTPQATTETRAAARPGYFRAISYTSATKSPTSKARTAGDSPASIRENTVRESELERSRTDSRSKAGSDVQVSTIYPTLRALEREQDALLDSPGVSRVIDRSRVVILTRSYTITNPNDNEDDENNDEDEDDRNADSGEVSDATSRASTDSLAPDDSRAPKQTFRTKAPHPLRMASSRNLGRRFATNLRPLYEEYEQFPASPWAQSPAPSPAIQQDSEANPFFASNSVSEEAFAPSPANEDYSSTGQVEAIGVDKAATILHIPFIHPVLSKEVASNYVDSTNEPIEEVSDARAVATRKAPRLRKSPIAILSVMASDVPYPHHLLHSLRYLGPHLATSFHTCHQNSILQERISGAIHRHQQLGKQSNVGTLPTEVMPLGLGLESLLQFDVDEGSSTTFGSIASPSEHSSVSRYSPVGSVLGTPTPDFLPGYPVKYGGADTSSQSFEGTGDYFDLKKRSALHRSKSGGPMSKSQLSGSVLLSRTGSEHRALLRQLDPAGNVPTGQGSVPANATTRGTGHSRDETGKRHHARAQTPTDNGDGKHSLLHSYGADFSASFQSLPVAAMPRTPGGMSHSRNASTSEFFDMPPPSERLLRTIIDSLPVQIFTAAPLTGDVTWVNSKYLVYRGQTPKEVLDDPWGAIHPDDLVEYLAAWQLSLHTGQQFQHKARIRRFDDCYRWYFVRAAPLRDKLQNLVHWIGTMIDLHDQHIAETNAAHQQEIAASEVKYRALANSSPQIVFAATRSRGIIFCNTQWLVYSGQSEEDARGVGFAEYVHPDDLVKCQLPIFDEESDTTSNVPISMPPEPHRSWSGFSSTPSDGSGESSYTLTGLKASPSPSIQLPQRKLSELAGTGILRASKDPTGKASYSTEVRLRMKNGEYRWHLVRVLLAEPIIQAENEEQTWYGTCTDINDHKELEQRLKETMDAKSRFLSNMSHEIRTPLNGIHGMATFLLDSHLTPEQLEHVNVIRGSTEGLRDLINDILDLSKVEAGMIKLKHDWFQPRPIIEEVNDLTSPLAIDKDIELNYLVEDDVPFVVKGDRFRFRQVLLNVIGNAIKFTNDGEVFIRCKIAADSARAESVDGATYLQVDVVDTGSGFSEKEAERLFKRFSQIDGSSTRQHGGSGLGLVISMQLVELHGGTMTATSTPGKGSTFTFTMRFGIPQDPESPSAMLLEPRNKAEIFKTDQELMRDRRRASGSSPLIRFGDGLTASPKSEKETPSSLQSSGSSSLSVPGTMRTSIHSTGSSQSSYTSTHGTNLPLRLPLSKQRANAAEGDKTKPHSGSGSPPPMYSILVVCPLRWTREATTAHLENVLTEDIPHNIVSRESAAQAEELLFGENGATFTHVILILRDFESTSSFVDQMLRKLSLHTCLVVLTNMVQKRQIISHYPSYNFDKLTKDGRLLFVSKPIKPSKLGPIFDPTLSRELSTDHNTQNAQQTAQNQKQIFDNMSRRLEGKDVRVLVVEDNDINLKVILRYLRRVSVKADNVLDGIQATDRVFSMPVGYYSIILLDLMMPNKDGYQTCKDIRQWEKENVYPNIPIVALSANVLNDAWQKCKEAGFNSYLTKPVEFEELSAVMTAFMDPDDPSKPLEFMKNPTSRSKRDGAM